jgi:rhodanese-related sulfurtransferase
MQTQAARMLQLLRLQASLVPMVLRGARPDDFDKIKELVRVKFPTVRQITTRELADWLADGSRTPPALVDVRSEQEFRVSHLKDALRFDAKQFDQAAAGRDKTRPLVLYCAVGYRSSAMAIRLGRQGFTDVRNLEGSIFQWARERRPLFRGEQRVEDVHPGSARWSKLMG